ncbi:MAG: tetratricopeptide repeat protein, partial [Planctomycetota bacterium]
MKQRILFFSFTFLLVTCSVLYADILHLNDGGSLEGTVIEKENGYLLQTKLCKMLIKADRVLFLEKKLLPQDEYLQRLKEVEADNTEANYILGLWCIEHKMPKHAEKHFAMVFKVSPNHKQAREAAGYIYYKKKWLARTDYMTEKGYQLYKGRWIKEKTAKEKKKNDRENLLSARARSKTTKIFAEIIR